LTDATRNVVLQATEQALAWPRGAPEPAIFAHAAEMVAEEHHAAAEAFLQASGLSWPDLDLVAMHGQTVLHERQKDGVPGRTVQLGDAALLARLCGRPVAYDFRSADMAAGGEGAPLAAPYHAARARASDLTPPVAVLNVGGVANVTLWRGGDDFTAFDTGPGNGMLDLLVQARGAGRFDVGGNYASVGQVAPSVLAALLADPYFQASPPKSLDRHDFPLTPLNDLKLEDACATLVAFTAEAAKLGLAALDAGDAQVIVTGGGRLNPELMKAFQERLTVPVTKAEDHGWRGDSIEAEAFAYLGARVQRGLPISFPKTTGVPQPMTGGKIARP
jgi:anhydro-N-acetylmuramic acid kinase